MGSTRTCTRGNTRVQQQFSFYGIGATQRQRCCLKQIWRNKSEDVIWLGAEIFWYVVGDGYENRKLTGAEVKKVVHTLAVC